MLPSNGRGRGPGGRPFGGRVRRNNFAMHPAIIQRREYWIKMAANILLRQSVEDEMGRRWRKIVPDFHLM